MWLGKVARSNAGDVLVLLRTIEGEDVEGDGPQLPSARAGLGR